MSERTRTLFAWIKAPVNKAELESYKAALEAEKGPGLTAIQSQSSTLVPKAQLKIIGAKMQG